MRELLDEIPDDDFLMYLQNATTKKWIVSHKLDPVAQFDTEEQAEDYVGQFNDRRKAISSARGFRNFLGITKRAF